MSYLQDKKIKRQKYFKIALGIVILVVLYFFRSGIFDRFSFASQGIFHPVLVLGNNLGGKLGNISSFFASKNSLYLQNQNLQSQLDIDRAQMSNYNSVLADNESMREILGRKNSKDNMVLAAILAKPNQSIYDTLIIDAGIAQGIKEGDAVFAFGNMPIGRVALVFGNTSKVILFSNSGEKTQAAANNVFIEIVGRGGGNFEVDLPKDFNMQAGDQIVMPGINPYVLAIAEKIISDPRDPLTKVLLSSPVNIEELKFVEVLPQK
jgi:cell shape-determining protein MreC